jgi:hypothetical protein
VEAAAAENAEELTARGINRKERKERREKTPHFIGQGNNRRCVVQVLKNLCDLCVLCG